MKTLFLDLQNGISGDMAVAALLNMNVMPFQEFCKIMKTLNISDEFTLNYVNAEKFGIFGGDFFVIENAKHNHMSVCEFSTENNAKNNHMHAHENETVEKAGKMCQNSQTPHGHMHHHGRNLNDIIKIIETSKISAEAKKLAKEIFNNLAEAESLAHNKDKDKIHFHEVGAVDSIADIVGFSVLFTKLKPDMVICSNINLGKGSVECEHGVLSVPAPAVLNLVKGFPVYCDKAEFEMTTPTGAAIVKTIVKKFDNCFNGKLNLSGAGFGKRDIKIRPNVLKIFLLEEYSYNLDDVIEINTNIDNTTAEDLGYCAQMLLDNGALDVCFSSVFMKKFRPGYKMEVLCKLSDLEKLSGIIFANTGTIGLRYNLKNRIILEREEGLKDTKFGKIKTKILHLHDGLEEHLEYDSLEEICNKNNISIKDARKL